MAIFGIVVAIFGPLTVLGYQVVIWLYRGTWPPLSPLILQQKWLPELLKGSWFTDPHSWYGLHKLVMWLMDIPLSFILFLIGCLLMVMDDE